MGHTGNNGSIFQKLITLRKVGQTWEMVPHVEKWGKLLKMICIWKNGSHLKIWVTVQKMGHTWISLAKMSLTWKNRTHLEK